MHHHHAYVPEFALLHVLYIVVWGFDKKTVAVLREMQGKTKSHLGQENGAAEKVFVYMTTSTMSAIDDLYHVILMPLQDSITSRVAGFACLQVLNGHSGVVSGLALAETNDHVYLVSQSFSSPDR